MSVPGSEEITVERCNGADLGSLDKVYEIFRLLSKYIHGKKIYSSNNPNLDKFAQSFKTACEAYFESEEELLLSIEQYQIKWRDQVVYENERRDESIAFIFYKDGVGEISIQCSVSFQELDLFVDIIKDETHNYLPETDVVTKLWRTDFENIQYRIFDEYFSEDFLHGGDAGDDSTDERVEADDHENLPSFKDRGRIIAGTYAPDESIGEYFSTVINQKYGYANEDDRERLMQDMLSSFLAIRSDELQYFEEAFSNERNSDKLVQFFAVVIDFARILGYSALAQDIQVVIERLINYFISCLDVPTITQILGIIKKFMSTHVIPDDCRLFFNNIEEKFSTPSILLSLGRIAQRSKNDSAAVFRFYRLVGKKTIPTILALLEDSHYPWLHTEACRTIIALAPEDIPSTINQLDMDNHRIAKDIVYILRKLETKEIHPLLNELVYYPDQSVKEDVIELLVSIDNDKAAQLLARLLDDSDKQIRIKTLKAVEELTNRSIQDKIVELAFDEDIELRNMDEQEKIFRVLGKLLGGRVMPRINGMIREKNHLFFGKKKPNKRNKILAIRALEQMNCPESMNLLIKLARDSDGTIRSMSEQAIAARRQCNDYDHAEEHRAREHSYERT
jgi:HEAT repeat protein